MKQLQFCDRTFKDIPCVLTVGVFDGLHLGHKKILEKCVDVAGKLKAKSVVVSFNKNPKMFCGTEKEQKPIISSAEKEKIMEETGVDYHCIIDFSEHISKISGEEFIALLCTSYNVKAMVVGSDFKCGNKDSSVGVDQIGKLLSDFTSSAFLEVVESVSVDGEVVSSSLIRRCLLTGDFGKASKLLGRPYNLG